MLKDVCVISVIVCVCVLGRVKDWELVCVSSSGDPVSSLVVLVSIIQCRALLSSMGRLLMCCLPTGALDPAGL